jgi:hypothetical protein
LFETVAVPEPSALILLAALASLTLGAKKRRFG